MTAPEYTYTAARGQTLRGDHSKTETGMQSQTDRLAVSHSDGCCCCSCCCCWISRYYIADVVWSPETVNGSLASASSLSPSTAAWLTVTLSVCLDHCFPLLLLTSSCFRFLSLVYTLDFTLINLLTCSLWSAWCIQFLAYYSTRMQSHCNIHFFHQRILDILHLFKLN